MRLIEPARAIAAGSQVTIWLPVQWPVITLSIVRRDTQRVVWQIAHESFSRVLLPVEGMDLRLDRFAAVKVEGEPLSQSFPTLDDSPLRYGEAPIGMKQFLPSDGHPVELE